MKLFLKILLFVFVTYTAKAEVINIAIFNIQKTTSIADLATFGGASLIKGGIKTGIKQGGKHLAKDIVGITNKMVKKTISKGTIYFDPKNGTNNYVLKNGFASGKDLLIGINPQTGNVTTVIRGNNLVSPRFIKTK